MTGSREVGQLWQDVVEFGPGQPSASWGSHPKWVKRTTHLP